MDEGESEAHAAHHRADDYAHESFTFEDGLGEERHEYTDGDGNHSDAEDGPDDKGFADDFVGDGEQDDVKDVHGDGDGDAEAE